ncbi:hypothetical protein, partial [Glaesserella parasuis]|uniref:hypothetical protein n=1 Tax=Glaesserella parasuis TaxID=738 RepID=UPI0024364668
HETNFKLLRTKCTMLWGADYFCIERKKKIWAEKMRWGLPHFLLGRVMQKVKWAKMVENGQFLQYFFIGLGRFDRFLKWV